MTIGQLLCSLQIKKSQKAKTLLAVIFILLYGYLRVFLTLDNAVITYMYVKFAIVKDFCLKL